MPSVQIECSGTAALVVALTALSEQEPGRDEIIAPAYTCPLVALAAAHCGLRLRVCDLRPASLDLCPNALAALCGPRTLAVLPTHLAGRVTDVAPVRALAHAAGARVIEDAAQALGAREQGGACIGTTGSDMVFFSLAVGKGLTIYEGGALVVADPGLRAACARAARTVAPGAGAGSCAAAPNCWAMPRSTARPACRWPTACRCAGRWPRATASRRRGTISTMPSRCTRWAAGAAPWACARWPACLPGWPRARHGLGTARPCCASAFPNCM